MSKGKWKMADGKSRWFLFIKKPINVCLLTFAVCHLTCRPAHALNVTNVTFTGNPITFETASFPNGTTIGFTLDQAGVVQVLISKVANFSDTITTTTVVADLIQSYATGGPQTLFWNALWLINGQFGRLDGNYSFNITLSTSGATGPAAQPSTLVQINSIDIHNVAVNPSFDSNHSATFPYSISYNLAKQAQVTVAVQNSSGTVVRLLVNNQVEVGETVSSSTVIWDGLGNDGRPVPIGIYTATIDATDITTTPTDHAITRTQTFAVQSLAGVAQDPRQVFENNTYVYPNPVRNGQGTFQFQTIRDGATVFLKIYTITGTLVFDKEFDNVAPGVTVSFPWKVVNQAGNKLGRGLYYYVVKETDPLGTLQVVKKMAVLP